MYFGATGEYWNFSLKIILKDIYLTKDQYLIQSLFIYWLKYKVYISFICIDVFVRTSDYVTVK